MKRIYLLGLVVLALNYSCESEEFNCEDLNLMETLSSEIDANNQALIAYTVTPTDENCIALKDTYQAILDVLTMYEDCEFNPDNQLEYNNFLQTSETGISLLTC